MATRTLEERNAAAEIRAWAADNGFDISDRGAIPRGVVAAYEAAHGDAASAVTEPGEAGPNWVAAAAQLQIAAPDPEPPPRAEPEGPPPPTSLDEARERAGGGGRRPPWAGEGGRRGRTRAPRQQQPVKVTAQVKADIEGKLALLLTIPAASWQEADPYCGGAFADNLDTIVAKAVPLICQSSDLVAFFTRTSQFMLLLDLAVALRPVATAVYRHHVAKTIEVVEQTGQVRETQPPPEQRYPATMTVAGHVPPVRQAN